MSNNDYKVDGSTYEISLSKLLKIPVKDIHGYISQEFGFPSFKVTAVLLENGSTVNVEGEHDFPYLTDGDGMKFNTDLMQDIYDNQP